MSSSDYFERCVMHIEVEERNSTIKSLSETASTELLDILENFNSVATIFLLIGYGTPDIAPEPNGIMSDAL